MKGAVHIKSESPFYDCLQIAKLMLWNVEQLSMYVLTSQSEVLIYSKINTKCTNRSYCKQWTHLLSYIHQVKNSKIIQLQISKFLNKWMPRTKCFRSHIIRILNIILHCLVMWYVLTTIKLQMPRCNFLIYVLSGQFDVLIYSKINTHVEQTSIIILYI